MLILASGGLGLTFFRISRDLRPNWAKCVGFPRRGAYFCVFAANCDGIRVLCGFRKGFIWVYTPFTVYFEVIFKGISTEISYFALPQIVAVLTVFLERARYVIILHSIAQHRVCIEFCNVFRSLWISCDLQCVSCFDCISRARALCYNFTQHSIAQHRVCIEFCSVFRSPILSYLILSDLAYPVLSYPIQPYPTLSYPTLSYPTLSYPILSDPILYCPILPYPIRSDPILSHLSYPIPFYATLSYPIQSHPILSYPILSDPILSYPILSDPILSCPILSYPTLFYPILSHPIQSYPILFCSILSHPIVSHPILSHPILSYPAPSYPILPYSTESAFILLWVSDSKSHSGFQVGAFDAVRFQHERITHRQHQATHPGEPYTTL